MDLSLAFDDKLLADSAERYLSREYSFQKRHAVLNESGFSEKVWRDFADLGWLAMPFDEASGGLGGGARGVAVLMEGFGRHLVLEPYLWSVVVAGCVLQDAGGRGHELLAQVMAGGLRVALAAYEERAGHAMEWIGTRAVAEGSGFKLQGSKPVVPGGAVAHQFIVVARTSGTHGQRAGLTLFLVDRDAPGVEVRPFRTHDGQTAAGIEFHDVPLSADDVLCTVGDAYSLASRAMDHGISAVCAEAIGSASYLVATTVHYLKLRRQYDKPLATFQVIQHRLADMLMACELGRSMSQLAIRAIDDNDPARAGKLSAAKIYIGRAARFVGQQAVQLHGGMGVSEELDVSHHFKRLTTIEALLGDEPFHLDRFLARPV